jgi:tetratricopeptide (TPR) repeat protein
MSFEQYTSNQDPVLEVALNFTEDGFILDPMQHLTELFLAGNYAKLKTDAAKIAKNPEYKFYKFQDEFSNAATRLINGGNTQAGLFILELIAELYPESASALYSLANVQEDAKLTDKAIASYTKIIAIDPDGSLAKAAKNRIKELNKQ